MNAAGPARSSASSGVRLAEAVAALSMAVDLGLGQPMEHVARSCLLAGRLGRYCGIRDDDRAALYYVAMLGWVGCIADSEQASTWFGDDVAYRAGVYDLDAAPLPFLGYLLGRAGSGGPPLRRVTLGAAIVLTGASSVQESLRAHCQVTAGIAERLGLGPEVCGPLQQIFARWDGKGLPPGLAGEHIGLPIRLWHVADVAEVHHRRGGTDAAVTVVQQRRGTQFDPRVVDTFTAAAAELLDQLPDGSSWEEVIDAEPGLGPPLIGRQLDAVLEVFADYADLKAAHLRGHSRAVADLCVGAARRLGMPESEVSTLRRAAWVHDLGRTGLPNTVLNKATPLTFAERERIRMHAYYTERMLRRPAALAEIGAIACLAHERLDGSGYHRGLTGSSLPMPARVLAAANHYRALQEDRPYRPALTAAAAATLLRRDAADGLLDARAVDAVLAVAGHRSLPPSPGPSGLTDRERQVLTLLARGATNRQIATRLGIAVKTAGNHIERIYAKIGVGTRPAATLFAMRHGLLTSLEPLDGPAGATPAGRS